MSSAGVLGGFPLVRRSVPRAGTVVAYAAPEWRGPYAAIGNHAVASAARVWCGLFDVS